MLGVPTVFVKKSRRHASRKCSSSPRQLAVNLRIQLPFSDFSESSLSASLVILLTTIVFFASYGNTSRRFSRTSCGACHGSRRLCTGHRLCEFPCLSPPLLSRPTTVRPLSASSPGIVLVPCIYGRFCEQQCPGAAESCFPL
jgi:hypothetical protein